MTEFEASTHEYGGLREHLAELRRRKWSVIVVTVLVVVSTMLFSWRQTPIYEATTKILVQPVGLSGSASQIGQAALPPNLETERELAASVGVARLAARELDLRVAPEALLANVTVGAAGTTSEILTITYADPNPAVAQMNSQAMADAYLRFRRDQAVEDLLASSESIQEQIQSLNTELDDVQDQISTEEDNFRKATLKTQANTLVSQLAVLQQQLANLTPPDNLRVGQIVAPADLPSSPAQPNYLQNGALALVAGLIAGVSVAYARERLDDRLRGRRDLEAHVRAPVLAVVPRIRKWRRRRRALLVSTSKPESAATEAYRTLRTGVLFAAARQEARTLLIVSPHPGDGKTATAANLGVVLAEAGKRVALVSADLRKPRLHRFFDANNATGLVDVLAGRSPLDEVLQKPLDNLVLLTSGGSPRNPGELLSSESMGKVLTELKEHADLIVLDAPPLLAVADAVTLAPLVDGVLFLADAENTTRGAVDLTRRQLKQLHAPVIGAVLNNFDPSNTTEYYDSYDGYYAHRYKSNGRNRGSRDHEDEELHAVN